MRILLFVALFLPFFVSAATPECDRYKEQIQNLSTQTLPEREFEAELKDLQIRAIKTMRRVGSKNVKSALEAVNQANANETKNIVMLTNLLSSLRRGRDSLDKAEKLANGMVITMASLTAAHHHLMYVMACE